MSNIYGKAAEYTYKKKKADWYWIVWSATAFIIFIIYYFFQDIIFSGLVFIIAIIITIASFKKPQIKKYSLDDENFYIDDEKKVIPFSEITSYNIDLDTMNILINTTNKIQPLIHVPFAANQNINTIDTFLSKKIKKDTGLQIPILELLLTRFLGF